MIVGVVPAVCDDDGSSSNCSDVELDKVVSKPKKQGSLLRFFGTKANRSDRKNKPSKGGSRPGAGRKKKAGSAESTMSEVISSKGAAAPPPAKKLKTQRKNLKDPENMELMVDASAICSLSR